MTPAQRNTFIASYLGWTLDAFDFFLVTFVLTQLSTDFRKTVPEVAFAITVTLMLRPVGAFIFGYLGDRYGRRIPLMIDIAFFSLVELATAFSPNFTVFLILRALYGIGMGGEWGLGSALAMETMPAERRGLWSGILQEGYAMGFLLAGAAYFGVHHFYPEHTWRAMFVLGVVPALLIFFIRAGVPESPVWLATRGATREPWRFQAVHGYAVALLVAGAVFYFTLAFAPHELWWGLAGALLLAWALFAWFSGRASEGERRLMPLFIYAVLLMASLNFMSHGTQDLYPTFLQKQHGLDPGGVFRINTIANIGAIAGGMIVGALSQRLGRRRAIVSAAGLGILLIPLWAFSPTLPLLALGGFAIQFMVQGAWGVIPAHLNELSPVGTRGTFPGFVYQFGNFLSAGAAQLEAQFAHSSFPLPGGGVDYARAMAIVALVTFAAVIVFTLAGKEARRANLAEAA
ncbi:MAG: MFS transporter [Candidatus Eremiobacteraeota bacterium]|nr:MFS transporter [Candidatus Eremiobacteraeota bacterium]